MLDLYLARPHQLFFHLCDVRRARALRLERVDRREDALRQLFHVLRRRVELHGERILLSRQPGAPAAGARTIRAAELLAERLVQLDLYQLTQRAEREAGRGRVVACSREHDQRVRLRLDALPNDALDDALRRPTTVVAERFRPPDRRK